MDFQTIKQQVLAGIGREPSASELAARQACMDLAYCAFALIDFGQATKTLELYTPDGVSLIEGKLHDAAARRDRVQRREADRSRRTRHQVTNFAFRLADPRTAYSLSLITIFLEDSSGQKGVTPLTVADCADRYERSEDGLWRIAFRYLQPVAGAPR